MSETMKIKTSWDEVTLGEYLRISKVETTKTLRKLNLKKTLKLTAILSNRTETQVEAMSNEMFATFIQKISFLHSDPPVRKDAPFKIKGKNYIFTPDNNALSAGEMISIEEYIKDAVELKKNFLPDLLAVLIRPCVSKKNKESGKMEHIIEPFATKNLEYRKNLFLRELKVPDFIHRIAAFTSGAKRSRLITSLSSVRITDLKLQEKELLSILESQSP